MGTYYYYNILTPLRNAWRMMEEAVPPDTVDDYKSATEWRDNLLGDIIYIWYPHLMYSIQDRPCAYSCPRAASKWLCHFLSKLY